jgi:4-hydroxybenzoate polyprenyltransferase
VTGRIQVGDLRMLRWIVTGLLIAINLPLGFPIPFVVFVVVFGLTWCSFHWFFWPAMSRYLLVAFVTHNPLAVALGAYAAAVSIRDFGDIDNMATLIVLLIGIWAPLAAWETSRKIRIEADETEYMTYSKVLGWRVAGMLPALFALISVACLISVAAAVRLSWIYSAVALIAAGILTAACLRFEFHPTSASANLRPYTELYSVVAVAGFSIALLFQFSVAIN